jgi:hypothetical protein
MKKILFVTTCLLLADVAMATNLPTYAYEYTLSKKDSTSQEIVEDNYNTGFLMPSHKNTVLTINGVVVKVKYEPVMSSSSYLDAGKTIQKDSMVMYIRSDDRLFISYNSLSCGQVEFTSKDLPLSSPLELLSSNGCSFELKMKMVK